MQNRNEGWEQASPHPLAGVGEARARLRAADWGSTPIGSIDAWSQSLTACVRICLDSGLPSFLLWGPSNLVFCNDAAGRLFGTQGPPACGMPAAQACRELWGSVESCARHVLATGEAALGANLRVAAGAASHRFSCSAARGDSGAISGCFVIVLETAPSPVNEELLAALSHELRTPLAAILIWGGVLEAGTSEREASARAGASIVERALSLSTLLDGVIELVRFDSGQVALAPRSTELAGLAQDAIEASPAEARAVTLELDLPAALARACVDPEHMLQLLKRLLAKAIHATERGGRVLLRMQKLTSQLRVEVCAGVVESVQEAVVLPKVDLALALCGRIAALHGGTLTVTSDRGPFVVEVPWIEPESVRSQSTSRFTDLRVLIVDENPNHREEMGVLLAESGAEVVTLGSGVEALAWLESREPSAVGRDSYEVMLCDLGLSSMSAYELMERVADGCRARSERVLPAGAVGEGDWSRAIEAGFEVHLARPFTLAALLEVAHDLRTIAAQPETSPAQG